ncbi:MAG: energy-coupling factor ABC transporter ATP-binding protein [Nitrospinota bacterium]|nr:energy-coupling factor ABC transporter ATP-binding protein [Nitrospinota bacterium]
MNGDRNYIPAVEFNNVSYSYPDGAMALSEISLTIYQDERVAILGANGAGKSTLLLHMNGLIKSEGNVSVFGVPVVKKNLPAIRRQVGYLFQNPDDQLFCPTVYEDVAFGPRNSGVNEEDIAELVRESLASVGLNGAGAHPPFHLSLGEKKRAAIATLLAMKPKILALDEPTASLDPRGKREISALLEKIGGTQVFVTHDLDLARKSCQRTIILYKGRVKLDGPTEDVLKDRQLLIETGLA